VTWQWVAGAIAAGCSIYAYLPYIRGILAGKRPSPVSWAIWAGLCIELTVAMAFAGGRAQLALPLTEGIGSVVVAVLAWRAARRRARRPLNAGRMPRWLAIALRALDAEQMPRWLAVTLLAGAAVAMAGWWFAGPVTGAALLLGLDLGAGAVTVNDVWHDPESEPVPPWMWYGVGELASFGTAVGAGWVFWASPGTGLTVAVGVIVTAWRRGRRARPPSTSLPPASPGALPAVRGSDGVWRLPRPLPASAPGRAPDPPQPVERHAASSGQPERA
jgi:hypothetical protein